MQPILSLAVSPARDTVALLSGDADDTTLSIRALDGSSAGQIHGLRIAATGAARTLAWSADGRTVYYANANDRWYHDIYSVDVQTGDAQRLTRYFLTNTLPVAVHPDGEYLLTLSDLRGQINVHRLHLPSREMRKITDYASPVHSATYAPRGDSIAYSANATDNTYNGDIYVMDDDGFDKRRAFGSLAGALDIVRDWSDDARYLAIESNYDGGWRVGVLDLLDRAPHWFTPAQKSARALGFSPGSDYLLTREGETLSVYLMPSGDPVDLPQTATVGAWAGRGYLLLASENGDLLHGPVMGGPMRRL